MSKFAETFWTPYTAVQTESGEELRKEEVIGKEFIVLKEKDKDTYDFEEVGVMYLIEFDGGVVAEAFPEEVETEWQLKNGREEHPNGF